MESGFVAAIALAVGAAVGGAPAQPVQTPIPDTRVQWNKGSGPADMGRGVPNPPGWYQAAVGAPAKKKVLYLTFDDGPSTQTPRLLKALRAHGARATFFVSGGTATMHKAELRRMHAQGHAVGNHTWSHDRLTDVSAATLRMQIRKPKQELGGLLNGCMRPPYGLIDQRVAKISLAAGFQPVMWTHHIEDWSPHSLSWTIQRLRKATRPGAVILMHDTHGQTVSAVKAMLPEWKKRGFELIPVPSCRVG